MYGVGCTLQAFFTKYSGCNMRGLKWVPSVCKPLKITSTSSIIIVRLKNGLILREGSEPVRTYPLIAGEIRERCYASSKRSIGRLPNLNMAKIGSGMKTLTNFE